MRYSLVPPSSSRKRLSRAKRPRKHELMHHKGGFHGIRHEILDQYRRTTQTQHFRLTLNKLLAQWGIRDRQKILMTWRVIYAHRVEPWYRAQEALRKTAVQIHDAHKIDTRTPRGEYAHLQRLMRAEKRRLFWVERERQLWEKPPIALRHVLKEAAPAIWHEFIRQV